MSDDLKLACQLIVNLCHVAEAYEVMTDQTIESDSGNHDSSELRTEALGFALAKYADLKPTPPPQLSVIEGGKDFTKQRVARNHRESMYGANCCICKRYQPTTPENSRPHCKPGGHDPLINADHVCDKFKSTEIRK